VNNKLVLTILLIIQTRDFKFQSGGAFAMTVVVTGRQDTRNVLLCVFGSGQCYYLQIIWKL